MKRNLLLAIACFVPALMMESDVLEAHTSPMNHLLQQAGKKVVKGVIKDESGLTVIGANVMEKGTTNGTITDLDGCFTLEVAEGAELLISYIGFNTQTISVKGQTSFSIILKEDSQSLDEVVVVGYGVQKKKLVTGATVQVKGEDLQKLNTVNPMAALQSQSPGVAITKTSGQPGSSFKVSVRGVGTVGDASPLYIVDGVTVGNIDYLSPSDIESIDVLKDAASAAIYGARAANGVILVTTKQGKAGKVSIEYDGYVGWQNINKKIRPLNAREYAMIMNEAAENSGMKPFDFAALVPDWDKIESGEWNGTDWLEEMLNKNAFMQNYSLGVRGGTEKSNFSLGLSYTDQEGTIGKPHAPGYTRYSFRLNSTNVLIKGNSLDILKMGENLNYTYTEKNTIATGNIYSNDIHTAFMTNPFLPVYDEEGNYHYAIDWNEKDANPIGLSDYKRSNNITKGHRLNGNVYLELQPIKNLKIRSSFGIHLNLSSYRSYVPVYDLGPQSFVNEDVTVQSMSNTFKWIFENTASYDWKIKDFHLFNFLIGTSAEKNGLGESIRGENVNSIFNDFEHAYLDNNRVIDVSKTKLSGTPATPGRLLSYFGRVNYNFKETYMATLVMRADGSSNFAPGNRWGIFPSVSVGWVISNEKFMKSASFWLDFLKLRASWGQNGNQNIAGFQYLSNISFDTDYFFGTDKNTVTSGAYPSNLPNKDVTWEVSEQIDLGVDARFFDGRLSTALDLYRKDTKDWLLVAPVLGSFGTGAPYINGGDVRNQGVELGLTWRDQIGELSYGISGNIAYNHNEVTRIANTEGIIHGPANILGRVAELYRAEVGYPIGYFWGYKTDGIFQNKQEVQSYKNSEGKVIMPEAEPGDLRFVDANDDGVIDDNDKGMIGDPNPDVTFGLSINLGYKGFDLSVATNGVAGNQIIRSYRAVNDNFQNYGTDILDRWHGEGTSNTVPRVMMKASRNDLEISERYIENGSYWRIANVTIGYDFKKLFKNLPFTQARLYLTGQNLATLTKYKGLDPEVGYGYDSNWASGIDIGSYPSARVIMIGVSLKY